MSKSGLYISGSVLFAAIFVMLIDIQTNIIIIVGESISALMSAVMLYLGISDIIAESTKRYGENLRRDEQNFRNIEMIDSNIKGIAKTNSDMVERVSKCVVDMSNILTNFTKGLAEANRDAIESHMKINNLFVDNFDKRISQIEKVNTDFTEEISASVKKLADECEKLTEENKATIEVHESYNNQCIETVKTEFVNILEETTDELQSVAIKLKNENGQFIREFTETVKSNLDDSSQLFDEKISKLSTKNSEYISSIKEYMETIKQLNENDADIIKEILGNERDKNERG